MVSATTTGGGAGDFTDEFENECGEDVQRFGIRVLKCVAVTQEGG